MTNIYDALRRFEQQAPASTPMPRSTAPPPADQASAPVRDWQAAPWGLAPFVTLPTDLMIDLQRKIRVLLQSVPAPIIQITSTSGGEGVTTVSQNLAIVLAGEVGGRVLLINPALQAGADVVQPDLLRIIADTGRVDAGILVSSHPRLSFGWLSGTGSDGPSGDPVPLFAALRAAFDFVIIDSGSVDRWVNEHILCKSVDALLLVVQAERTRWPRVEQTLEMLGTIGGRVSGVVLNQRRRYVPTALTMSW